MSAEASGYVFRHSPYRGAALQVHLAIADSVNDQHGYELWMSMGTLAKKARLSRPVVSQAVEKLRKDGYLSCIERHSHSPSRFLFLFPDVPVVYETRGVRRANTSKPAGDGSIAPEVSEPSAAGVSDDDTNPKNQPKRQPKRKAVAAATRPPRRDLVWEALCTVEDVDWRDLNSAETGKIRRARKLATESSATAAQIMLAARAWPTVMGNATMTANGVMTNFRKLLNGRKRATEPRTATEKFHARMEEALANGLEESGTLGGADGGVLSGALGDGAEHRDLDRGAAPAG